MSAGYILYNVNNAALAARVAVLESNEIFSSKVSLTSAQILNLNTTPIQILPSPGAGKMYRVFDLLMRLNFVTTAYAVNVNIILRYVGVGTGGNLYSNASILISTLTRTQYSTKTVGIGTATPQYVTNTAIEAFVLTGNPTLGDGTLDIYLTYQSFTP